MVDFSGEILPKQIEKAVIKVPESEQDALRKQIADCLRPVGHPEVIKKVKFAGYFLGAATPFLGTLAAVLVGRNLVAADSEIITGVFSKIVVAGSSALVGAGGFMGGLAVFDKLGRIAQRKFATIADNVAKYFDGRQRQANVEEWLISERLMD